MGYILMLVKTLSDIGSNILIKEYNRKHTEGGLFFTGVISLFAMLFFLLTDRGGLCFTPGILPYAAIFGLLYSLSYYLTFIALACGPFALSMLICSYSLVIPVMYGILFFRDPVSLSVCIGLLLLAVSLYLVRADKRKNDKPVSMKWLISISVTAVSCGILAVIQKIQQIKFDNAYNNEFMITALGFSALLLITGGLISDRKNIRGFLRFGIPYAGSIGIANGLNNLMALLINNIYLISVAAPFASGAKIVISFIVSRLLFGEKYLPRQITGVFLGAAAVVCLNLNF